MHETASLILRNLEYQINTEDCWNRLNVVYCQNMKYELKFYIYFPETNLHTEDRCNTDYVASK
jgi:hypothetical protein